MLHRLTNDELKTYLIEFEEFAMGLSSEKLCQLVDALDVMVGILPPHFGVLSLGLISRTAGIEILSMQTGLTDAEEVALKEAIEEQKKTKET